MTIIKELDNEGFKIRYEQPLTILYSQCSNNIDALEYILKCVEEIKEHYAEKDLNIITIIMTLQSIIDGYKIIKDSYENYKKT